MTAQQSQCCETKQEVVNLLSGSWILKNTNPKIVHSFSLKNGKGTLMVSEEPQTIGGAELIIDATVADVDIVKTGEGFTLKFTSLEKNWDSEIVLLNSKDLILKTEEEETEYGKVIK